MKKNPLPKFVFLSGCLLAGAASAAVPEDSEAPVLHAGGVSIYPGLSLVERYNDNLFRSDVNKRSSYITVISPSVLMEAWSGANVYSLGYVADVGRYASSSADNYDDHTLTGLAELSFSTRAKLSLTPQFKIGHDERGSTYSAATAVPNTWHSTSLKGSFTYGSDEAMGRVVVDAGLTDIRYQNNRTVTTAFDKELTDFGSTFYYRLMPKTYTFAQFSMTNIDYQDPTSPLDGDEKRAMIGVTWNATAQTSGSFKIGQLWKNFDSPVYRDFNSTSWEGSLRWSPREHIRLDLISGRKAAESTGVGSFVWVTSHQLDLSYDLNGRTTLHLLAGQLTEDFAQVARNDETTSYGVKVDYKLRKWLTVGGDYTRLVKTSTGYTGVSPEYHNNIYSVYLRTEL